MVASPGSHVRKTVLRINLFQLFNTASFTLVNGVPMVLFFRELGASDWLLGIVAALGPALNLLQIPATRYLPRVGYRRLVVGGWSLRTGFIAGMALVPWVIPCIGRGAAMAAMLLLLLGYNASRGASLCGFLPWMASLVPEGLRGWYLARDLFFSAAANLLILTGSFLLFRGHPSAATFSWTFWGSFAAGVVSLWFLRKVPDFPVPAADRADPIGAPTFSPRTGLPAFFAFNALTASSLAAGAVFWVPLLEGAYRWDPAGVFGLLAAQTGVVLLSLAFLRNRVDRFGSRPVLIASAFAMMICFSLWAAIAARRLAPDPIPLAILIVSWGIGFACFPVGNVHQAMRLAPGEGRSRYFARFSVVNSLALGAGPILWGGVLAAFPGEKRSIGPWEVDGYAVVFLCLSLLIAAALFFLIRLPDSRPPVRRPGDDRRLPAPASRTLRKLFLLP